LLVGVSVLGDRQVLRDAWLIPLRDLIAAIVWFVSLTGDTVTWRGERFRLRDGKLTRIVT
jgi:ceramide glucosyltransferase